MLRRIVLVQKRSVTGSLSYLDLIGLKWWFLVLTLSPTYFSLPIKGSLWEWDNLWNQWPLVWPLCWEGIWILPMIWTLWELEVYTIPGTWCGQVLVDGCRLCRFLLGKHDVTYGFWMAYMFCHFGSHHLSWNWIGKQTDAGGRLLGITCCKLKNLAQGCNVNWPIISQVFWLPCGSYTQYHVRWYLLIHSVAEFHLSCLKLSLWEVLH